jgi:hypothetical protein
MNIKRILISEQEKKSILGLYNDDKTLVNEQFNSTNGTYTVQKNQTLYDVVNSGKNEIILKGTKAWHNFDGSDSKIYLLNKNKEWVYYDCSSNDDENIFYTEKTSGTVKNDPLSKVIRTTFCNGKKIKTWEEITGKKTSEVINKPKTIKLKFTDEEICELPNDKKWHYATQGDKWYASKNNIDWFDITNNKKAVNILKTGCKNLKKVLSFNTNAVVTDDDTMAPPTANNVNSQPVDKQQSQPNITNNNLAVTNKPLDTEIGI